MRADLLALTDESLALLANVGLVKRAQKEIEAGTGPRLDELPDGTVVAASRDGATTRLPPGASLKMSQCTCGSSTVCRHRIGAVLAYRRNHGAVTVETRESWNPGSLPDEELLRTCGAHVERAGRALSQSCLVTVTPGAVPQARLPTATVQFLVPNSVGFAKCDCLVGGSCEHVVLAVWAFRAALPEGGLLELGTPGLDPSLEVSLDRVVAAIEATARHGIADASVASELAAARAAAEDLGLVWIADALEAVERQADAYSRQSARFSARATASLFGELQARVRAARHGRTLPSRFFLGSDEARETLMEQVRLIALGVELEADNERRFASIYFAHPDGKQVLVLRKEWSFADGAANSGAELGALFASSRMSVAALAQGELVTRAAKRRANGELDLGVARGMKSSLLPGGLGWSELPEPILLRDVEKKAQAEKAAPPTMLRPRRIGADVHVVSMGKVLSASYARAAQELVVLFEDEAKNVVLVRVPHRAVAPEAIDTWAAAFGESPKLISGHLHEGRNGWVLEPLAIVTNRLVVPALARQSTPHELPAHEELDGASEDELEALLMRLEHCLERGVVKGARSIAKDAGQLATALGGAGMSRLAAALAGLAMPSDRSAEQALIDVCLYAALLRQDVHAFDAE